MQRLFYMFSRCSGGIPLRRLASFVLLVVGVVLCSSCASAAAPTPVSLAPSHEDPSLGLAPTLLAEYWQVNRISGFDHPETSGMRYLPGQFASGLPLFEDGSHVVADPGSYAGWDVLRTREHRHATVNYGARDFVRLQLNRAATVAVLWHGSATSLPAWLEDWQRGGDVTIGTSTRATFTKVLQAGEHWLGTGEGRNVQMYSVLLAEADGSPWTQPSDPLGRDLPTPNTTIPRDHWLHERHFAQGPDGNAYPTWHEQIDRVFWVYYAHDHGSDPANFAAFPEVQPIWGYSDPSVDFSTLKLWTFDIAATDGRVYSWMVTTALGSSLDERVCKRHHTFDIAIADRDSGELIARLHHMADYGYAQVADSQGRHHRLKPDACPEQYTLSGTNGRRTLTLADNPGYSSWQPSTGAAFPLIGNMIPVTDDPMTRCTHDQHDGIYTCNDLVQTNDKGVFRWFNNAGIETQGFGFDSTSGDWGEFCTDRYGRHRVSCDTVGALIQYVKPGVHFVHHTRGKWLVNNPWSADYVNSTDWLGGDIIIRFNRNLEGAVVSPN